MASANFSGLRVLALESRHAKEISKLIPTYGGQPIVAPALREVRLESNRVVANDVLFQGHLVSNHFLASS